MATHDTCMIQSVLSYMHKLFYSIEISKIRYNCCALCRGATVHTAHNIPWPYCPFRACMVQHGGVGDVLAVRGSTRIFALSILKRNWSSSLDSRLEFDSTTVRCSLVTNKSVTNGQNEWFFPTLSECHSCENLTTSTGRYTYDRPILVNRFDWFLWSSHRKLPSFRQ